MKKLYILLLTFVLMLSACPAFAVTQTNWFAETGTFGYNKNITQANLDTWFNSKNSTSMAYTYAIDLTGNWPSNTPIANKKVFYVVANKVPKFVINGGYFSVGSVDGSTVTYSAYWAMGDSPPTPSSWDGSTNSTVGNSWVGNTTSFTVYGGLNYTPPPAETFDYSIMTYIQKKETLTGLVHDYEYKVKASTMKIITNITDFNEKKPVTGRMYFDVDPLQKLTYYFNVGQRASLRVWGGDDVRTRNTAIPITQEVGAMTKLCASDGSKVGDPEGSVNSNLYGDSFTSPVKAIYVPDDTRYPSKYLNLRFNDLKDETDVIKDLVNGNGGSNGTPDVPIGGTPQDAGVVYGTLPQDSVVALFTSPMGLDTFKNTLDKLQHFDTSVPPAPKVKINLNQLFNSFSRLTGKTDPFPSGDTTLIDFDYLNQWQYGGYSIIQYFRLIIGFGFILSTFEYCRRKIYSGRVIS